jgi:hypothetical protein
MMGMLALTCLVVVSKTAKHATDKTTNPMPASV